jgi:hypothetical protein
MSSVLFRAVVENRGLFSQLWAEGMDLSYGQEVELKTMDVKNRAFVYAFFKGQLFGVVDVDQGGEVMSLVLEDYVPLIKQGLYRAHINGVTHYNGKRIIISIEEADTPYQVKEPFTIKKVRNWFAKHLRH